MIGQDKLVSKLKSYSTTTLPHSILLLGEEGCGKHTLAKELAEHFNLEMIDISTIISLDILIEMANRTIPTLYVIDCSVLTDRHQNIILKFLEEPSKYAYLVLLCTNKSTILQTVANRCVSFEFEPYSRDTLARFITPNFEFDPFSSETSAPFVTDDSQLQLLDVCTTPGQVLSLHSGDLGKLQELCETIITKMHKASYQNTLSITQKINLKDEFDKFDINVFFNVLLKTLEKHIMYNYDRKTFNMYGLVSDYKKRLRDNRLNKELFVENFLTKLWEFARCEN